MYVWKCCASMCLCGCIHVSVECDLGVWKSVVDGSAGAHIDYKLAKADLELRSSCQSAPPECCEYKHVPPLSAQGKNTLRFIWLLFMYVCLYQPHLCRSCGGQKVLNSLELALQSVLPPLYGVGTKLRSSRRTASTFNCLVNSSSSSRQILRLCFCSINKMAIFNVPSEHPHFHWCSHPLLRTVQMAETITRSSFLTSVLCRSLGQTLNCFSRAYVKWVYIFFQEYLEDKPPKIEYFL